MNRIQIAWNGIRIEIVDGVEMVNRELPAWVLSAIREDGIACIIEMQSMIGIVESPETAAQSWDRMSWHQRVHTFMAYGMLTSEGDHTLVDPRIRRGC